jgi:malate dehydrogenase (oxaloacetate-decarboxylating)(NADP+)
MIRSEDALEYHSGDRPGKIEIRGSKHCLTAREMRLAYLPGARIACEAIMADRDAVFRYTARGNLVGVITNGSAVPGLGAIGPLAAKPMQEGLALLFKRLADIDAFDLELDTREPDRFIDTVRMLEPTFGAVILKDLRAPEGLHVYERLCQVLGIPVFHENLQSTAVVATAALINALALAEKDVAGVRMVICGAGTVGIGCARLFLKLGIRADQLYVYDSAGLLSVDRTDLNPYQMEFAREGGPPTLAEGLRGADVFVGASAGGVVTPDMVRSMTRFPIVFALATPFPEIEYDAARACRHDVIVATGLAHFPNAVVDLLSFPYVLRGALDVHATRITDGMLLAAAAALAELGREEVVEEVARAYGYERLTFGPEYLLPTPIDPRILVRESAAVARQAVEEGVALRPLDPSTYQESLAIRLGTGRETLRRLIETARQARPRVVFAEGTNDTVLRAASILMDEGAALPILLGPEAEVRAAAERLGLDSAGITIVDPARTPRREAYAEEYFNMRRRRGVMRTTALERLRHTDYVAALMLHTGDADLMISGIAAHYADSLRTILEVIDTAAGVQQISSHYMVLLPRDIYFFADCAVNVDPGAEALAEIALLTAGCARTLGIEPRVAMLSFSNFGSVDHPSATKVRKATEIVKARAPELVIDGEMQLATALSTEIRTQHFPFSDLKKDANVLIFPDLQSGALAMQLLQQTGDAVVVGPVLMGTSRPVHLTQYGSSVQEVVNLAVTGIVHAAAQRHKG